jgi:hypothetical protein
MEAKSGGTIVFPENRRIEKRVSFYYFDLWNNMGVMVF